MDSWAVFPLPCFSVAIFLGHLLPETSFRQYESWKAQQTSPSDLNLVSRLHFSMRRLWSREGNWLALSHTASQQESWNESISFLIPTPVLYLTKFFDSSSVALDESEICKGKSSFGSLSISITATCSWETDLCPHHLF